MSHYDWQPLDISPEEFLMTFFEANEQICFQILNDKAKDDDTEAFKGAKIDGISGEFHKIEDKLKRHNTANRGIFFVVNFGGHKTEDIRRINAHFMEIDDVPFEEQIERIEAFPLEPSLIVKTQKSYHCYWLMKSAKLENFRYVQRQLVAQFGADPQNINVNRVFRVPGFYHCKNEPVLVQCVKFNPELRYTQEELSALLPDVEPEPTLETKTAVKERGTQQGLSLVGNKCLFLQHCKKNAKKLSEPDWYAMIANLALFEGGEKAIHQLSKPYPNYDFTKTQAKIEHFFNSGTKPITCAKICYDGFKCPKHLDKTCPAKAPAGLAFFEPDAAELSKFLKSAMFKSKGDPFLNIEIAHRFIENFMYSVPSAKAEVFINNNIKEHFRLKASDIKALPKFQKELYSVFSTKSEARKARQRDQIPDWYDTTNRGTFKYLPGVHADHLSENIKAIFVGDDYYFYEDGYYAKKNTKRAQKQVRSEMISRYATKNDILDTEFQWQLLIDKYSREINTNPYLINLGNGIFDTNTWKLQSHDSNILSTIRIGGNYDAEAKCPLFLKFLSEVLPESEIPLIQEMLGYFLVPITKAQKCFVMQGKAQSGKSTLLYVVQEILLRGTENVSSLTWNELSEKFGTVQLYGKMANIFADLPNEKIRNTGTFKAITGEDNISAQHKFRDYFSFKPFCRLLFSCQSAPKNYEDNSDGFYRRLIIVVFDHSVPEDKKDGDLKEKLMAEQDGILMWSLEGLKRLMANKYKFSETARTNDAVGNYKSQNSSILAFVQERCVVEVDSEVRRQELYSAYQEFCNDNGYKYASSLTKFNAELDGIKGITRAHEKDIAHLRTWRGIRLL